MNPRTFADRLVRRLRSIATFVRRPRQTLRRQKSLRRLRRGRLLAAERWRRLADYDTWFRERFALSEQRRRELQDQLAHQEWLPCFSLLMVASDLEPAQLEQTLESVLGQIYPYWELWISVDGSTDLQTKAVLQDYAAGDSRIGIVFLEETSDVADALNVAWEHGIGDFYGLLNPGDQLTEDAFYRVWQYLKDNRQTNIVYSDEDQIDEAGRLHEPSFKPDWSPEYFLSKNYLGQFTVVKASVTREVGGFRRGLDGASTYDLLLRCLPRLSNPSAEIGHIPRVLYHRLKQPDSVAPDSDDRQAASWDAGLKALSDYSDSLGEHGFHVERGRLPETYRARWPLPAQPPLVSLIIPTRDRHELLSVCVDSILEKTDYPNYEILIVDNQTTCATTLALLEQYRGNPKVRVLPYTKAFNFSAICNWAVTQQNGSITGLVNNDIEVIHADWMTEMVSQCCRTEIGCVGAKLRYGDNTIQHAGVILGLAGTAAHAHHREPAENAGYLTRLATINNYAAVTAACLLVRRCIYDEVGGMDEVNLTTAYNDVDFCLRVWSAGYRNVFTPYAELYHYESQTRGLEDTRKKKRRFAREVAFMQKKWGELLKRDPYYNVNLETDARGKSFELKLDM